MKKIIDNYDETASRIKAMSHVINEYRDSYDMKEIAEVQYERLRAMQFINPLNVNTNAKGRDVLGTALTNIGKSISPKAIIGDMLNGNISNTKNALQKAAMRELRSSVFARAVGPIEELPIGDFADGRLKKILANTQISPEQKLVAKIMQQQSWNGLTNKFEISENEDGELKEEYRKNGIPTFGINANRSRLIALKNRSMSKSDPTNPNVKNKYHDESDQYTLNSGIKSQKKFNFSIYNTSNGKRLLLPAYIESISESVSTSWETISLLNRSEDMYIYSRASRDFTLKFWIFASNADDLSTTEDQAKSLEGEMSESNILISSGFGVSEVGVITPKYMWYAINSLHQATRPSYSNGQFTSPPYCSLIIGDLFNHTIIIENLGISYDPLLWNLNVLNGEKIRPTIAGIDISGKILHGGSPSSRSNFYGVN